MEVYSSEPASSLLSYQFDQLLLRADANFISHIHALGFNRASAGAFLVRIPRNAGSVGAELSSRQKSSAPCRILGMGRRVCRLRASFGCAEPGRYACNPNGAAANRLFGRIKRTAT